MLPELPGAVAALTRATRLPAVGHHPGEKLAISGDLDIPDGIRLALALRGPLPAFLVGVFTADDGGVYWKGGSCGGRGQTYPGGRGRALVRRGVTYLRSAEEPDDDRGRISQTGKANRFFELTRGRNGMERQSGHWGSTDGSKLI